MWWINCVDGDFGPFESEEEAYYFAEEYNYSPFDFEVQYIVDED